MASKNCSCKDSTIVEGIFGEIHAVDNGPSSGDFQSLLAGDGETSSIVIKSFTLSNSNRMEVVVITWGATIVSLKCPDKYGRTADIVLGFEDLKSYMNPQLNQFFGCVLGRCANRVKNGTFSIKDKDYQLSLNENYKHHLHGGHNGFGRQIWEACVDGCTVVMSYMSEDDQEGYPGAVLSTIRFKLTPDNKLEIGMRATTSKSTIVNLSHGSLFNLAGHDAGESELRKHRVSLNCDRWTFTDLADPVPTGAIRGVGGTVMDLRIPRILGDALQAVPAGEGFDHNFCVIRCLQPGVSFVGRALHAESGRILEVYSDQPGVQFYTGGRLPSESNPLDFSEDIHKKISELPEGEAPSNFASDRSFEEMSAVGEFEEYSDDTTTKEYVRYIPGKSGAKYEKFCAFSMQPQNYPNAVNFSHFPCPVLRPGQVYYHDLTYKFGVQLGNYM